MNRTEDPLVPTGTAYEQWQRRRAERIDPEAAWLRGLLAAASERDADDATVHLAHEVGALAPAEHRRGATLLALLALESGWTGSTRWIGAPAALERALSRLVHPNDAGRAAVVDALALFDDPTPARPALAGPDGPAAPVVVGPGTLEPHRSRWLETRLAASLAARLRGAHPPPPEQTAAVARILRAPPHRALSDEQRAAVRVSAFSPVAVVTGGPGTGKTTIVVALLDALEALGTPLDQIALAAPTGKATHRLSESVRARRSGPTPRTETLHRLLGARPGQARFAHGPDNPLPLQVLVVDESSMLDLALATRMVDALPPEGRLVLLGDVDQLPSVDAGAVLEQLVGALPEERVARLTRSYRMREDAPEGRAVLGAARGLLAGDPTPVLDGGGAVRWHPLSSEADLHRLIGHVLERDGEADRDLGRVQRRFRWGEGGFLDADRPEVEAALAAVSRAQLLTLTRREGFAHGAERLNQLAHRRYARRFGAPESAELLPGEPVMMLRNDYERRLFNGDIGVVLEVEGRGGESRRMATFPGTGGPIAFDLEPLARDLALAFAITVHKAQGSEYDRVFVVLPEEDIDLATRQMLYTAATRAKRGLVLAGRQDILHAALARTEQRSSGLGERLRTVLSAGAPP